MIREATFLLQLREGRHGRNVDDGGKKRVFRSRVARYQREKREGRDYQPILIYKVEFSERGPGEKDKAQVVGTRRDVARGVRVKYLVGATAAKECKQSSAR